MKQHHGDAHLAVIVLLSAIIMIYLFALSARKESTMLRRLKHVITIYELYAGGCRNFFHTADQSTHTALECLIFHKPWMLLSLF